MTRKTPILVAMVLALAGASMGYFVVKTSKTKLFGRSSTYFADFDDASGIRQKTRVQINGIDVGRIVGIAHVRDEHTGALRARVEFKVDRDFTLYDDAVISKAAESLLGDFRLDLNPGTPNHTALESGGVLTHVHSLSDIDEIKGELLGVAKNVNQLTKTLSSVFSSESGEGSLRQILAKVESSVEAIDAITHSLKGAIVTNDEILNQIIRDVGQLTHALAGISTPGGDLESFSHSLASVGQKVDHMADSLQTLLGDAPTGDAKADAARGAVSDLSATVHHLRDISRKIDDGQGTLGRVVNDPGIADKVEDTLSSVNQIIGSIASLEAQIELRSEYDVPFKGTNSQIQPSIKNTLALRLFPKPDKYYIIEAISDPRGKQTRTLTTTALGGTTITADETTTSYNALKFSAEFAKRYFFTTLRFGIIENTGGLGFNLHALDERFELRVDMFDFARRDPKNLRAVFPRLRATGMYELAHHIILQGGFDDPFNTDLRTWFLGGVLRFTDEDLKAILAVVRP